MCLYGNDIDEKTSPVEARLNFAIRLDKNTDFIGRAAIQKLKEKGQKKVQTGFKITGKGIPRQDQEILSQDAPVGKVSSGTLSPTLGVGIGMGYVPPSISKPGLSFDVKIRDRTVGSSIVKLPFYQRRSENSVVAMGEEMDLREFRARYAQAEALVAY